MASDADAGSLLQCERGAASPGRPGAFGEASDSSCAAGQAVGLECANALIRRHIMRSGSPENAYALASSGDAFVVQSCGKTCAIVPEVIAVSRRFGSQEL